MEKTDEEPLLSCPFCSSFHVKFVYDDSKFQIFAQCNKCLATGPKFAGFSQMTTDDFIRHAKATWNMRENHEKLQGIQVLFIDKQA